MFTKDKMKLISLLTIILLLGCTESKESSSLTELEGRWSSICIDQSLGFSDNTGSNTIVTTYSNNSINNVVNSYSDTGCSQLVSTVDAEQSTLFASPGGVPASFSIGNLIKSSNGVDVKEIDIVDTDENKQLNIFLLQDNGNTLYFGLPVCPLNNPSCGLRPTEINYAFPQSKIN